MGAVVGVLIGYALGTRAGDQGWAELADSWKVISESEEVRDLVAAGLSIARDLFGRGSGVLTEVLSRSANGDKLRSAA
jgi:hypothetical protein